MITQEYYDIEITESNSQHQQYHGIMVQCMHSAPPDLLQSILHVLHVSGEGQNRHQLARHSNVKLHDKGSE